MKREGEEGEGKREGEEKRKGEEREQIYRVVVSRPW